VEGAVCVEVLYDEELKTLQSAFDQVCANLGVDEHDEGRRARLAMELRWRQGSSMRDVLRAFGVLR
jgi:hypothetical protein